MMIDCYKRISRTAFIGGVISCAGIFICSVILCSGRGNKYLAIFALIINSACAAINFERYIKYRIEAKKEAKKCHWCVSDFLCFKGNNMGVCLNKEQCDEYLPNHMNREVENNVKDQC